MARETSLGSVLVVGGCGFLGHHIVKDALAPEHGATKVSAIDLKTEHNRIPDVGYYAVDITQRDRVRRVLEETKPRVIFHTASPRFDEQDNSILDRVNIDGTRILIECAQQIGTVEAFVYTSSSGIVHNCRFPMVRADESWPVLAFPEQPLYYGHTKGIGERIVLDANRMKGDMLTVAIRPASLYGPGDAVVTSKYMELAHTGKAKFQLGNGKDLYDSTYIGNMVHAEMLAAHALLKAAREKPLPKETRVEGEAFFVRDDEERVAFWDMPRIAASIMGRSIKEDDIWRVPRWLAMGAAFFAEWLVWAFTFGTKIPTFNTYAVTMTTMERTVEIDKIKERLSYSSKYTREEGLRRCVEWYMKGQDIDGKGGKTE
ncbi:NAD(P)-binding protein [Amniculicola lignicola CBS 123094]|uniref:NAD(P)-binding protein n=1 Tax=Amniculicola lignicola CBS 123094 TaxID=1392246 RepID=A0A6A5VY32_9PLEO|nr:NAD(P)-binding protein [Amniculicola lignicola CBS 123094]